MTIPVSTIDLHGHRVSYRTAGEGPVVVLIHGITGSGANWDGVQERLAKDHTVIVPDLLGHGESAKPRGDYSLGAFASGIRDLLAVLGHARATLVGHSLGGGIAMQFAYQFPERVERLVLVSSGGLGRELNLVLRAAALPGSELVLPVIAHSRVLSVAAGINSAMNALGLRAGPDLEESGRGFASLGDHETRMAFLKTVRGIIDPGGQTVNASDRLYFAEAVPTLLVWGARDRMIPAAHGHAAHRLMPGSRLEIFEQAGHFPHRSEPERFLRVLRSFLEETEPAQPDRASLGEMLRPASRASKRQPAVKAEARPKKRAKPRAAASRRRPKPVSA